jgi:hypothetical protein
MASLHTVYLSYHANLPSLPSLVGLVSLQSVYFGYLDCIKEIPSTGEMNSLQVIALEALPLVRTLPDVAQYENTLDMVFVQNTPVCCSGFLSEGACNTTFPSCCGEVDNDGDGSGNDRNGDDSLPSTCLKMPTDDELLPTNTTLSVLHTFAANTSNFCDAAQATCSMSIMSSKLQEDDTCAGVLYRECSSAYQGTGICFNEDMGRVKCTFSQKTINMRKAEIAAGCSCDEVEEKWLGCT